MSTGQNIQLYNADFTAVYAVLWLFLFFGFSSSLGCFCLNVSLAGKRDGIFPSYFLGDGIYPNPTENTLYKETVLGYGTLRGYELFSGVSWGKTLKWKLERRIIHVG